MLQIILASITLCYYTCIMKPAMLRVENLKGMKTKPEDTITAIMDSTGREILGGLTKREYFAAMSLSGLSYDEFQNGNGHKFDKAERVASRAVSVDDALITALNGKEVSNEQ